MASIENQLKKLWADAAQFAPTQRDPKSVPADDDDDTDAADARDIDEVISGLLGGTPGAADGSSGPDDGGGQRRADAVKRMSSILGAARKKARGG